MQAILNELAASGPPELVAVILGLAYLILAARLSLWCWPAAFVSTAIFLWLYLERGLYQQSLLQVFYLVMAVYGFVQWRGGAHADPRPIVSWTARQHLAAAGLVAAATLVTGAIEARYTPAALPYVDAFTTWGSVITTWMVARKVLENWLYWLVVDGVLVYLMIASHLVATAVLFAVYLGIVVAGYFTWRRELVTARPA